MRALADSLGRIGDSTASRSGEAGVAAVEIGDDFWRERGFTPMTGRRYVRLSAFSVIGTVFVILV